MRSISSQHRQYVQAHAPWFVDALAQAKQAYAASALGLKVSLDAFDEDPFVLYAALWLADTEGIPVTLTPQARKAGSRRTQPPK